MQRSLMRVSFCNYTTVLIGFDIFCCGAKNIFEHKYGFAVYRSCNDGIFSGRKRFSL